MTVEQRSAAAVNIGQPIALRLWYFSQTTFEPAQAQIIIALGETTFYSTTIALPTTEGELVYELLPSPSTSARRPRFVGTSVTTVPIHGT